MVQYKHLWQKIAKFDVNQIWFTAWLFVTNPEILIMDSSSNCKLASNKTMDADMSAIGVKQ